MRRSFWFYWGISFLASLLPFVFPVERTHDYLTELMERNSNGWPMGIEIATVGYIPFMNGFFLIFSSAVAVLHLIVLLYLRKSDIRKKVAFWGFILAVLSCSALVVTAIFPLTFYRVNGARIDLNGFYAVPLGIWSWVYFSVILFSFLHLRSIRRGGYSEL